MKSDYSKASSACNGRSYAWNRVANRSATSMALLISRSNPARSPRPSKQFAVCSSVRDSCGEPQRWGVEKGRRKGTRGMVRAWSGTGVERYEVRPFRVSMDPQKLRDEDWRGKKPGRRLMALS